ncbi:hypothetical protein FRB98_008825 [Tulasnella sp. 332]|nr:hypothetical protein FRB98_008825 [Tulasnella sp. 332]
MAATATASSYNAPAPSSSTYHHHHHSRRQSYNHLLSPHQAHHSPSPHSSPLPTYSPLSSGLPSPSFPSPIALPSIPRGRSPGPSAYYQTHQQQVSRHPSRQQSVRRLSSISGFSGLSRTPTTTQFESFDHHDFSTIQEEILLEGDIIGQGDSLHGETIELVQIPTSAARPEQPPSTHLQVVRKLGAGSYAVVYLVKEILSKTSVDRSIRARRMGMGLQFGDEDDEMDDDDDDVPRWEYEYGREFAVKCLSKASLSPEELVIQMFEATLHQSLPTHPNIVTLYRTLQTPSFLLLVLESVPGQDLFYFLEQSRDSNPSLHHPPTPHSDPLLLSTQPPTQPPAAPLTSSTSFRSHAALNVALSTHTPPTPSLLSQFSPNNLLSYARLKLITSMFAQMCDAVDACHQQGVSHRDIKPENFIVTEGMSDSGYAKVLVKLSDFGLATTQQESADVDCGSAPYMSYECRNNVAPTYATQPADVWSLGIVLINMLYHHNPWSDTATVATTQTEIRRHTGQLNVTTITTFNPPASSLASSHQTHSCSSFSAFLASPVQFFLQRFPGMTPPVADFLANHVFCVLDTPGMGGPLRGWSGKRASAKEFGEWVRRLPGLMGQGVGLGLVNAQPSSAPTSLGVSGPRVIGVGGRPAPLERRGSRLANEMWLDEDENENEELTPEGREREREMEEEREVEQLMMLPLEPQSPRGENGVGGPPSTFVWDKVLMASSATLVKLPSPKEVEEELAPSPLSNGGMDYSPVSPMTTAPSSVISPPLPTIPSTGTITPPMIPSSENQNDSAQSVRSPSAKRRGKRGARRKDKSQPPADPHSSSAVQSPLLGATGMDEFPSHLDLLANDVETLASSISQRGSTKSSRLSATERALARLPPSPSVPPPPPPPGMASVAKISALGRKLSSASSSSSGYHVGSMSQASLASSLANGVGFGDIGVGSVPVATHQKSSSFSPKALSPMPEEERERSPSSNPITVKTAPSPFSHSPAPVVQQQQQTVTAKKSWRSRFGLNSSSSPSPSSPPPASPPTTSHATPSALESPMSMMSLKPIQSKSSLRNEVARGPGASSLSATDSSPAAVATSSPLATGPRYNDLYPGQPPMPVLAPAPSMPPPAPPAFVPSSSTSPPNFSALRARQGMEAPSWRSSVSTTNSSVPSSSAASIMTSSGSSTFTRFSNSSVRSVSTMATSAASSMKSDGRSWRDQQLAGDDRPRPRKQVPSNVKRMDGIPRELDGLRTSLYQPPQPPRIKGVLSNSPQTQNDLSSSLPNQHGGNRPRRPPQPQQPYEPVTLFPAYLHHRKAPPARLDSIAEAKSDQRTSPTNDTKLAPVQNGGSGSGKLREAPSTSDLSSTASRGSASTSASGDVDKSQANQKGQGTALQKMFWGLKR